MPPPPHNLQATTDSSSMARPTETALFFRAWLRNPLSIASLVPSSPATGRAFTRLIDLDRPGDILELGSGTGAISRYLLSAGVPASRLIMVEREPEMANHLRDNFPDVRILQGDATALDGMLDRLGVSRLSIVVSSLPIVWFPLEAQASIIEACFGRLDPDGAFLQMTNQPASPLPMKKLGLAGKRAAHIWRNLPPSFIWRYWRPSAR